MSSIDDILNDPEASDWLKHALRSALERDPVDAANDAEILAQVLEARAERMLHIWPDDDGGDDATQLEDGNGG